MPKLTREYAPKHAYDNKTETVMKCTIALNAPTKGAEIVTAFRNATTLVTGLLEKLRAKKVSTLGAVGIVVEQCHWRGFPNERQRAHGHKGKWVRAPWIRPIGATSDLGFKRVSLSIELEPLSLAQEYSEITLLVAETHQVFAEHRDKVSAEEREVTIGSLEDDRAKETRGLLVLLEQRFRIELGKG